MTEDERKLMSRLVEMSRKGPVESWLTRMADLIAGSGIDTADINWSQAPHSVAYEITTEARRHSMVKELLNSLDTKPNVAAEHGRSPVGK